MLSKIARFLESEDGPTSVEYAVMLALIVVTCISVIGTLGTNTAEFLNQSAQALDDSLD